MFELILTALLFVFFILYWQKKQSAHQRRLQTYKIRIHVNGIRGKSTVTRLVAGILREAGYRTVGKTTGSAAVVIDLDGNDVPIRRKGAPNVKEQQDIIAEWEPLNSEAMVIECMALQPQYQAWTEKMVLQAHIGIITNVREDHQDVMGETLPEIATSLAQMCPRNGLLITAEYNPTLQAVLRQEAERSGSQLLVADPTRIREDEVSQFDYLAFKDNLAIGLSVADALGIEREIAIRGMLKSKPDIGVVRLQHATLHSKPVIWANLFAVNDRESMIISMDLLEAHCDNKTIKIGILNNRFDRERRAEQFSDVAVKDLTFDQLITFGAFEDLVTRKLIGNGYPPAQITNLGFSVGPTSEQIIEAIASMIPEGYQALLVGFVNIHTPQAEMMMEYFDGLQTGHPEVSTAPDEMGYLKRQQIETVYAM